MSFLSFTDSLGGSAMGWSSLSMAQKILCAYGQAAMPAVLVFTSAYIAAWVALSWIGMVA